MGPTIAFGALAALSILLLGWQVFAAARFPLHQRRGGNSFAPPIVLLKPLKGADAHTAECLRSWMRQKYPGKMRILFGVGDAKDHACDIIRSVIDEFPAVSSELVIAAENLGASGKVSKLIQLARHAKETLEKPGALVCISDADVRVPPDFLSNAVAPLKEEQVGLVSSLYRLANPVTFAMRVEAAAVNVDFWSQVLQSNMMKPQTFALGAVMVTRAELLRQVGGLEALSDYIADDYELGNRIAKTGHRIELTTIPVECWDPLQDWKWVWRHQLRWARTIRISQPASYFFSILNNVSLWATAFAAVAASMGVYRVAPEYPLHVDWPWICCCVAGWGCALLARGVAGQYLAHRMTQVTPGWCDVAAVLVKDWLQAAVWIGAFTGNTVIWRGIKYRITRSGKLVAV